MTGRGADQRALVGGVAPVLVSMTSLCVGSSFAKSLFPLVGAVGMTGLRNGLSAVLMTLVFRPWRWRLAGAQRRVALGYGAILGVMNLSFYLALARLPIGVAIALEFLGPLGVALWASSRRLDLVWMALAAGGVALLAVPGLGGPPLDPLGVALVLVAAACWAAYILVGQRATRLMSGPQVVSVGLWAAALVSVPPAIVIAGPVLVTPAVLASGLIVAILCSALPYPLELFALRRLPAHVFGVLVSLEPAIGALAAMAVLGERLSWLRWVAIGLVVVASIGVTATHKVEPLPA